MNLKRDKDYMTTFTCLVTHGPHQGQHSYSALLFCIAAVQQGHKINQVFFYADAVVHGNAHLDIPSDEFNMQQRWQAFASEHSIPLVICTTVASRHGVHECVHESASLASGFVASGLTEYMESVVTSERLVQF